jgi:hypothetical protein
MNKAKRNNTTKTERRAQTDKKNSAVNNDRCKVCTRFKIGF